MKRICTEIIVRLWQVKTKFKIILICSIFCISLSMKRLFLIDDDVEEREIFQEALVSLGVNLQYSDAVDGQDALNKLMDAAFPPVDIIFVDRNMPRMNGHEFLSHLIELPQFSDIPVIFYSTSPLEADDAPEILQRISRFVTKRNSIVELCAELTDIFTTHFKTSNPDLC